MPGSSSIYNRTRFRTEVQPGSPGLKIRYCDGILLMGSCFTEHIGSLLARHKFSVDLNPFGIVYNPAALARQLERLADRQFYTEQELACRDEVWYSFDHHGRFSAADPHEGLAQINDRLRQSSVFMREARHLVLTFGTAYVYELRNGGKPVANCHRFPEAEFIHRLYDPEELLENLVPAIEAVRQVNPGINLIWSISPVRYLKEGAPGSQLAKANLFLMVERLLRRFPESWYFPAYEIFMDDLRDYRYYATDMIHPGEAGIAYVWDRFSASCLDPEAKALMDRIGLLIRSAAHKPTDLNSSAHKGFIRKQMQRIREITGEYPWMDFGPEIRMLQSGGSELP